MGKRKAAAEGAEGGDEGHEDDKGNLASAEEEEEEEEEQDSSSESDSEGDPGVAIPIDGVDDKKGEEGSDRSGSEEESESEEEQVSFDFVDPAESFFHGISALLRQYLPEKSQVTPSSLADLIVNQPSVGTLIVQEGEEDVFAFISALPIQFNSEKPPIKTLVGYLLANAGESRSRLESILSPDRRTGLLIHEQMVNLPLALSPRMHECLRDDVDWALENEISEEHKKKFKFDSFLLIAPRIMDPAPPQKTFCRKPDDEILLQASDFHFSLMSSEDGEKKGKKQKKNMKGGAVSPDGIERVVAVLTPAKYWGCLPALDKQAANS